MLQQIKSFFTDLFKPKPKPSPLVVYREMEFYFKGPQANIWSGDSVAFNADTFIENDASEPIVSTAIPGDNTKTFLARIENNILKFKPKKVLLHISGNDFLGGKNPDGTLNNMKLIYQKLKAGGVEKIGWIETLPLGNMNIAVLIAKPDIMALNLVKIPQFILKMKLLGLYDVVEIRKQLQKNDGFIQDKYNAGDNIHCNALAYQEVWVPIIKGWFSK